MTSSRRRKERALEERVPEKQVRKEKDIKNKACPATSYVEGMPFLYLGGGEASSYFSLFRKKWGESPHLPQPTLSPTEAMRWVRLSR